jgi:3-hydroxyisobutyrate dehydrogenase-like beta-hydroxyacid dehydrogenase
LATPYSSGTEQKKRKSPSNGIAAGKVDAPVPGGMEGAQTRELLVMAGGDPAV